MTATDSPRPGRRDPEGRRTAILDAAAELICEQGASSLTHRAVASRAGVAVGSTTQYFDSIDDLREQALKILADDTDKELAALAEVINGPGDLTGIIDTCAGIVHEFLTEPRQVAANLATVSTAVTDPSMRRLALQWGDQLTGILTGRIGPHRAAAVVAYIDGLTVHAALHDAPVPSPAIAAVLDALATMPEPPEAAS